MSNQFYDYIAVLLLTYFSEQKIKPGDRYYLQLDKAEDVEQLISSFKNQENVKQFVYKHEFGELYQTFLIEVQGVQLVIAHTSELVKPDFLVTLRNQVGEQKGVWEHTALFSIVSTQLDSIQGGSSDLQKEGMPLHPNSVVKKLKRDIEDSTLDKIDQIILLDKMELTLQEQSFQQITFFEFEDLFTALAKGCIDDKDYKSFGLFKDPELATLPGNKLKERLEINHELFDFVRRFHEFGLEDEIMERKFSQNGATKLKNENWSEASFSEVLHFNKEAEEQRKKVNIELKEFTVKGNLDYWDRPQKETAAGNRKRHIIIFNPNHHEEIQLNASFSFEGGNVKSLSEKFVSIQSKSERIVSTSVGRTNLQMTIKVNSSESTFAKIAYRHEGKPSLGAEFLIVVIPTEAYVLDSFKTTYIVEPVKGYIGVQYEGNEIKIGDGISKKTVEVQTYEQVINLSVEDQLILNLTPEAFNDEDQLLIHINIVEQNITFPILLINELPESIPITAARIWKLKREFHQDFDWHNNRLLFGNREFYLNNDYRQFFEWEQEWIESGLKCAEIDSGVIIPIDITLSDEVRETYNRFINFFSSKQNIPSLCYYHTELKERAKAYISAYIQEIQSFKEGQEAGKRGRDLFKLGVMFTHQDIYFTPFHPLVVAFQLQLYIDLDREDVDNNILTRLRPDGLVPFIYNDKEQLYKPDPQNTILEWLSFKPVKQVSVSDANKYLAKVVEDKISQFEEHFGYLFVAHSKAPLKINLINIENDHEVLRGIIFWMLDRIKEKGMDAARSIELTLYRDHMFASSFDQFSRTDSIDEFQNLFNIQFSSKEYDPQDLMRVIRNHISFYKRPLSESFEYAHVSFYKMQAQEHYALQPMGEMVTGLALNGLHSFVPSMKSKENYRTGFGIKEYSSIDNNLLVQTSINFNELSANLRNGGNDSYHKGEAIYSRTTSVDESTLDQIFKSSYWVTFVDSNIDLEFFNNYGKNLVVIHYSDQYSSSNRYDAITVTDKSQQYFSVIKEFLVSKNVESSEESVRSTIKAFNTFNGEWLLRIIGSKGHYSREKLSIISAIKFALAYFDHPNILWVPISLEEILRVAGAVNLSKSEGVFTAKNLGVKGAHSDDLLLVGLEDSGDKLYMHFYPVEVKIGINQNNVLDKAKIQVKQTKKLIREALSKNNDKGFTAKFYRNFFAQLYLTNATKLSQSQFWTGRNYRISDSIIERLLKDEYKLPYNTEHLIGEGAVLSFQKDAYHRSAKLDDGITYLNLTEYDGYSGLVKPMQEMHYWIQDKESDFIKDKLLSNVYQAVGYHIKDDFDVFEIDSLEPSETSISLKETVDSTGFLNQKLESHEEEQKDKEAQLVKTQVQEAELQETQVQEHNKKEKEKENSLNSGNWRILIGRAENSNKEIYWEYGNTGLANRHLLISGKSGQGKTYFMQCLLLENSKLEIPSIVIDYTEGFLPNQLEPEFVEYLGSKLIQKIVYNEQFPINPFQKNIRDIGGMTLPESNTDVAERIKSVFSSVYSSLGIQQLNAIYEAVLTGLEKYSDQMSLPVLKDLLEEDGSNYSKTALSQIRPLIDRNPFSHQNSLDWKDVVDSQGSVFIIQLTGYPRDVQLMITEFILWDLWNYTIRFGNKNKPLPVVLDEAQNLDHTEKSPSAKILTEGRKFGWSGWYATQFLKSQLGGDELARLQNASQKVYFSQPEQETSFIASSLVNEPIERKKWETKLLSLKKGQCIIHAPILKENGELSNPTITVVDIIPLLERIRD